MTELLTQSAVNSFNAAAADPFSILTELVVDSFNMDCNECSKAAFQLASEIPGSPIGNAALTSMCGANFTGA
jgi:hypothetical protein